MTSRFTRIGGGHYLPLLRLGFPIMVGQMGTILMGMADTLMVGHYSTSALAASGFVNNIVALVLIAAMGFSYGITPIVGALMGEGRADEVGGWLRNALVSNLALSVLLVIVLLGLYAVLPCLGLPAELLPMMRPYLLVLAASIPPQMAFNAYRQFSDATGDTRTPMWLLLGSNVLNVVLNWVLIYGLLGLPSLGLLGAGIATLVSRVALWVAFFLVFRLSPRYRNFRPSYTQGRITRQAQWRLCGMGWPVALQLGMETASFGLSAFYVGWLGPVSLAAHQTMLSISQLCFMLYYGLSAAVAVRVSHFRGAGDLPAARSSALAGFLLCLLLGAVCCLPIWLLRHSLGLWFTDGDVQVASMVAMAIVPFILYQIGDALQCTYANALRGIARVKPMIWIAFVAYFVVSLPLGYLFAFPLGWALTGVWMAFPFGLTTAGILYCLCFYGERNRVA